MREKLSALGGNLREILRREIGVLRLRRVKNECNFLEFLKLKSKPVDERRRVLFFTLRQGGKSLTRKSIFLKILLTKRGFEGIIDETA